MIYLEQNAALVGHKGLVTKMVFNWFNPNLLVSASRDKTLLIWDLNCDQQGRFIGGRMKKSLVGHGCYVNDVVLSEDAKYALSGSADKSLRLWELDTGKCVRKFVSHTDDVTSVCFSDDYRLVISGSMDKTIKIWNILGECKATFAGKDGHTDWITSVRFSHFGKDDKPTPVVVSSSWDKTTKMWDLNYCTLMHTRRFEVGPITSHTMSPDNMMCVVGGKTGVVHMLDAEDLADSNIPPLSFVHTEPVVAMAFSPNRYWLAVAYESNIKLYDLDSKEVLQELKLELEQPDGKPSKLGKCTTLEWSAEGANLFAAFNDWSIRVWSISHDFLVSESKGRQENYY